MRVAARDSACVLQAPPVLRGQTGEGPPWTVRPLAASRYPWYRNQRPVRDPASGTLCRDAPSPPLDPRRRRDRGRRRDRPVAGVGVLRAGSRQAPAPDDRPDHRPPEGRSARPRLAASAVQPGARRRAQGVPRPPRRAEGAPGRRELLGVVVRPVPGRVPGPAEGLAGPRHARGLRRHRPQGQPRGRAAGCWARSHSPSPATRTPTARLFQSYGLQGTPSTVFYDAAGHQTYVHQGPYTDQAQIDEDIQRYTTT